MKQPAAPSALSSPSAVNRRLKRRAPAPMALEARLMFDGAVVDTVAAVVAERPVAEAAAARPESAVQMSSPAPVARDSAGAEPAGPRLIAAGDPAANGGRREIAFVDTALAHWQNLVAGIGPGVEVVLLDARQDGVRQMADYLAARPAGEIDAIHLLGHGESGSAVLGTARLSSASLPSYREALAAIGSRLTASGDVLLYGCDIAQGASGVRLIGELAQLTAADVAASTDATGAAANGGNWTLEARAGEVGAVLDLARGTYSGTLALPGAHVGSTANGVFIGGNYIELGIRTDTEIGKFGTSDKPANFDGRQGAGNAGVGMVGDADGFRTGSDLRLDYFMPGTHEEGFYIGYKVGAAVTAGKNCGQSVVDLSAGDTLKAKVNGQQGDLKVEQLISFNVNDRFFKNTVTLTNVGSGTLDAVRFMRSFDPDNSKDIGGAYDTIQTIDRAVLGGDSVSVVSARSKPGDAYATASGGKQASILYYTSDSRARVSFAEVNQLAPAGGIYDPRIFDAAPTKGATATVDGYISIAFEAGALAAGGTATFTYYTSLDNRDIATIIGEIAAAENKSFNAIGEDPASNPGQSVSAVFGGAIAVTGADNAHGRWQYSRDGGSSWGELAGASGGGARLLAGSDLVRFIPDADWNGATKLNYQAWDGGGFSAGDLVDTTAGGSHFSANAADAGLTVTPVNDAPVATAQTLTMAEDGTQRITLAASDADGAAPGQFEITALPTGGKLYQVNADGSRGAEITAPGRVMHAGGQVIFEPAANANGAGLGNFAFRATDSGGASSAPAQVSVDVSAVNDAPVATAQTLTMAEDGVLRITLGGSDVDGDALGAITLSTLPGGGKLYQVNADGSRGAEITAPGRVTHAGGQVIFEPAANAHGAGLGNFAYTVTDAGGTTSAAAQVTVNVDAVNDAPVLGGGPGVTYTENASDTPVLVAPGITLGDDLFAGNLGGAVLNVDLVGGQLGDQLTLRNEGNGAGQLGFAINQGSGAITYGGRTIGILASTNEGRNLTITFANNVAPVVDPASVTREAVEAVLKNLQFFNSAQKPVPGDRSVRFSLNDGAATGSIDYAVRVVPTNDAPTDIIFGTNPNDGAFGGTQVAPGHNLVDGLGRPLNPGPDNNGRYTNANFGEIVVREGDDNFDPINVADVFPDGFNFCGKTYTGSEFYVGWNGYVTFGQGMTSYAPSGISQSTVPIIAPMFLDFDTRGGKSTAPWSADGGKSTGSNRIYVDKDVVNKVITITYDDVGEYNNRTDVGNSFQIRLWNKGGGDFDIEFRYEQIGWAQHGAWTSAGWSAGDRKTFSEIEGSMTAEMANLASKSNIGQAGVFLWQVRDGGVRAAGVAVTENSAPGTLVTPLVARDVDDSAFNYAIRRADGSYGDSDGLFKVARNATSGRWELLVAEGANFDYETARSHSITLRVTDGGGDAGAGQELRFEKSFTIPVLNVNERPETLTLSSTAVTENSAGGTFVGTLGTRDVDAGDAHTYSVVGGAAEKFMVSGNQLVVKPGAQLDYESLRTHTVTIRCTDKGGLFREETFTIDVRNVYEPAWFDNVVARAIYTENGAPAIVDGAIRVLAPENRFAGGFLQVAVGGNGEASDRLSVVDSIATGIRRVGDEVFHNGVLIGRLDASENGQGGRPLRIVLDAAAGVDAVQALARSIGFASTSENPGAATRGVQFTLFDGINQATKAALVDVRPVNDAPTAALPPTVITERSDADPSATTFIRGLTIADVDELGQLTVVLSSKDVGGDRYGRLTLNTGIAGGLAADAVSGNGSGVVTLRGTLAQINATLGASNGLSYTPGLGRDSIVAGNDRLSVQVTDSGGLVAKRGADIVVIPGKPTAHSGNFTLREDSATGIPVDLSALVVDLNLTDADYHLGRPDPDVPELLHRFTADMEIRAADGSLQGYRLGQGQLLLQSGTTLKQGRFTYHPAADWNGVEQFSYIFQNSQKSSELAYIRIFVTPVNDAPNNATAPEIAGDLRVDGSLRQNGTYSGQGVWTDIDNPQDELNYRYQWQIADDAAGTNLRDLDGATLARYQTDGTQIGKFIRLKVVANDGELDSTPAYSAFKEVRNADPELARPPVAAPATESVPFVFTLPEATFTDADGDRLSYSATLADGRPLPGWLHFDPQRGTFSGTPQGGDVGELAIRVTASDGGPRPASGVFTLRIDGVPPARPDVPTVPGGIPGRPDAPTGIPATPGLPPGLPGVPGPAPELPGIPAPGPGLPGISGAPGTPEGGHPAAPPAPGGWPGAARPLDVFTSFRPGSPDTSVQGGFSGISNFGDLSGLVYSAGLTRAEGFPIRVLTVGENAHRLSVGSLLDNHEQPHSVEFTLAVPSDAFVHTRVDALIRLDARRADGRPLPEWFVFDAEKGEFSGQPPAGYAGDLEVVVTARDEHGNEASQKFRFRVGDAKLAGKPALEAQLRTEGSHARSAERLALLRAARAQS